MQVPKPIMLDFSMSTDIAAREPALKEEKVPAARQQDAYKKSRVNPDSPETRQERSGEQEAVRSAGPLASLKPEQTAIAAPHEAQALSGPASASPPPMVSGAAGNKGGISSEGGSAKEAGTEGTAKRAGQPYGSVEFGSSGGPSFLIRELPAYPPMARRMGKEARVVLRLTIDEKGSLLQVETVENPGFGFAEAAIEAVRKSSFVPAKRDGKPVMVVALLPVRFQLKRSE